MKLRIYILSVFLFSFAIHASATTTATWVRTTGLSNISSAGITVNGLTSSTTDANAVTRVYFEYGTNISNLASTTAPLAVPLLSLDTNKHSIFSATVTDVVPGIYNYFRAVRKITYNGNSTPEYVRGQIYQTTPPFENRAPEILAIVPYVGSACQSTTCNISIPENFSLNSVVATIYTRDLNSGQSVGLSIASGNTNNAFYINGFGQLKVNQKALIDYETITSFSLVIEVRDSGTPQKTDTVNLVIAITDVTNENVSDASYATNNVNSTYVSVGSVGGNNTVPYATSLNVSTYSTVSSVTNRPVNYVVPVGGSTYSNASGNINNNAVYLNPATGSTYNSSVSGGTANPNYVFTNTSGGAFGSNPGFSNNSNLNYITVSNGGSTYGLSGGTVVTNVNYSGSNSQAALTDNEKRELLQILIELKAEIDRRVRLGIQ